MESNPDWKTVVDAGTGAGYKLVEILGQYDTYGIDVEPVLSAVRERWPSRHWIDGKTLSYEDIVPQLPPKVDLLICSDVIEHVRYPDVLLKFLMRIPFKRLLLSTPDRAVLRSMPDYGESAWKGPPLNLAHYREWSTAEFIAYLQSHSLVIESSHLGVSQIECQWHVILPSVVTTTTTTISQTTSVSATTNENGQQQQQEQVYQMLGIEFNEMPDK